MNALNYDQMNLMKKWIEVLRSGEFKQANGSLRVGGNTIKASYCCLGVLCEIYDPKRWDYEGNYEMPGIGASLMMGALDGELETMLIKAGVKQEVLISMNDNGQSFEVIADEIERAMTEHGN